MSGRSNIRDATPEELEVWDSRTVDAPGGHVYQSRAWGEHRIRFGRRPRFVVADDGGWALVLTRPWPLIGGGTGYLPRGPVPLGADPSAHASRLIAIADAFAGEGIDVVTADPEVPAAERGFRAAIEAVGFRPIEEIQASRHRITVPLEPGSDEPAVFEAMAKSTRQRIHAAERAGVAVVRHDDPVRVTQPGGVGEGFTAASEAAAAALERFYGLLLETAERRSFSVGPRDATVAWWRAALEAGHLVYLEARTDDGAGAPLAGLLLYRHGGRISTVHSGDHAASRKSHPGALHLLRWRAIQLAIREGCDEMDLGGVDAAGAHGEPQEGDPLYGLYQHKRSFGGRWLALTGAHERIYDPRGYAAGRTARRILRLVRR